MVLYSMTSRCGNALQSTAEEAALCSRRTTMAAAPALGSRPLSLKAIFVPPLGKSWDFERHILTSTRFASSLRSRVALARQRRTNTVATKKADEKDDQQQHCKSHDDPAPRSAEVTY